MLKVASTTILLYDSCPMVYRCKIGPNFKNVINYVMKLQKIRSYWTGKTCMVAKWRHVGYNAEN